MNKEKGSIEKITIGTLGLLFGIGMGVWGLVTGHYWIGIGSVVVAILGAAAINSAENPKV